MDLLSELINKRLDALSIQLTDYEEQRDSLNERLTIITKRINKTIKEHDELIVSLRKIKECK